MPVTDLALTYDAREQGSLENEQDVEQGEQALAQGRLSLFGPAVEEAVREVEGDGLLGIVDIATAPAVLFGGVWLYAL